MGASCSPTAVMEIIQTPATAPTNGECASGTSTVWQTRSFPPECLPTGAKAGQVLDVAKLYIQDHPDKRYVPAPQLIVNALKEKFPCN